MKNPLVSILIPNYNYGQYVSNCLDSVLNQTYDNYEVIISDNRSQDDSYNIIMSYSAKFKAKGIWYDILQNKRNIGSSGNTEVCFHRSEGKYFIWLSSDDALEPTAIEEMVKGLEEYPTAGCAMIHRNEIDEHGNITAKPSFYNQSCFIPGEEQAAVYMMAGIGVSSQILFRRSTYIVMLRYKLLRFQVAGDWYDNFLLSCFGDVIYIKKPLVNYRVHSANETSESERNLLGILEHYQLILAFENLANSFGMTKPQKRKEEAVKKLGVMALRYVRKMILNEEYEAALKYLQVANIFDENITENVQYNQLADILNRKNPKQEIELIENDGIFERLASYDPPENSVRLTTYE